ncbi:MAG: OsmC family protein [Ferruginibacter sp.]
MPSTIFVWKHASLTKNEIMGKHTITTIHNNAMHFTATISGHPVLMDTADEGGSDLGPSPKRLMLASLAGCTGMDIVSILHKMKVPFSEFALEVSAALTDEHPKIYKDVKITYRIKLADVHKDKMQKAVNLSQDKYCGVSAMFKSFSKIVTEIIYV